MSRAQHWVHSTITGMLGKGGMGEVYSAKDTRLGRDVAIKVLPEDFARDPERLSRFEREAQTLASLNHPNVATVHGYEHDEAKGVHYLVMEYIDGETLGQRIMGKTLSVADAVPLFIDMARGLDAAHQAGIVHRDLKPENVKINEDGVVKIIDFGIAKSSLESKTTDPGAPTTPMSPVAITAEGTFMGTPVYMSPEQARGRSVDKRTDIWAFGCCLYESLTGDLPFKGETVADTVGAIMERKPDFSRLPEDTPKRVKDLLARCLEKDPKMRLRDIGDAWIELSKPEEEGETHQPANTNSLRTVVVTLVFGLLVGAAAMFTMNPSTAPETDPIAADSLGFGLATNENTRWADRPVRRHSITLPSTHPVARNNYTSDYSGLEVSPDGADLLYPAQTAEGRIMMKRSRSQLEAQPIPGTEDSHNFSISPSGETAITHKGNAYWKIPAEGGRSEKVLDAPLVFGAVWEDETHVIFGSPVLGQGLLRLDLQSGQQETITEIDATRGEVAHVAYQVVRDKHVLFYCATDGTEEGSTVYAMSLDTMESKHIVDNALRPIYVDSGHVIYAPKGRLMALPYDIDSLEATGPARDVTPPYLASPSNPPQGFTVTPDGDLIHVRNGGFADGERALVWVNMDGQESEIDAPPMHYQSVALSRSETRLRVLFVDEESADKWVYDLDSGLPPQQLSFNRKASISLVWIDDGEHYVYSSPNEDGGWSIYQRSADGVGEEDELIRTKTGQWYLGGTMVTQDGSVLLGSMSTATNIDSQAVRIQLNNSLEIEPIFDFEYSTADPMLSPDGQWLAYGSSELNLGDIFVTSYPALEGKWRVTSNEFPRISDLLIWAPDGTAIYYRSNTHIIRVPVSTENGFRVGRPEKLFEDVYYSVTGKPPTYYAIHPDGEKFLFIKPIADELNDSTELIVIENWVETLRNPDLAGAIR